MGMIDALGFDRAVQVYRALEESFYSVPKSEVFIKGYVVGGLKNIPAPIRETVYVTRANPLFDFIDSIWELPFVPIIIFLLMAIVFSFLMFVVLLLLAYCAKMLARAIKEIV